MACNRARRPVMEVAGIPHELIAWTATRGAQIAACRTELELEYTTATGDDGAPRFLPVVSERARMKLNRIAARTTRPAKPRPRPLAQLRQEWKTGARAFLAAGAGLVDFLLERARAAAGAIRARVPAVVDVGLAAVDVAATVFVMNGGGWFHRRHLLAEARRHLALVLRGRRRAPGLDEVIVDAALAVYCLDITEVRTARGALPEYRLFTARWALSDFPPARRPPAALPAPGRPPSAGPAASRLPLAVGEWAVPRVPLSHDRAVIAAAVVQTQTRIARRATRRQTVRPEQFALFDTGLGGSPVGTACRRGVDLDALRTSLEALELTAEQLHHLGRAGQRFAALRKDAHQEQQHAHRRPWRNRRPPGAGCRAPDATPSRLSAAWRSPSAARPAHRPDFPGRSCPGLPARSPRCPCGPMCAVFPW
ncbi:relaxase domain-containing protein [Streptomyces macrosporus]|uniref:TrwC relaxase domain-containing protein n=1 Tax=Streptomyces macrosporus TaxID=44032 RepID=A0ABP5X8I5_9ACTN